MVDNSDYIVGVYHAELEAHDVCTRLGSKYVKSCLTSTYNALVKYYKDILGHDQYLKGFEDYLEHFSKNEKLIINYFKKERTNEIWK